MKSRNNLAIVLLLTILTVAAFAFPASADSWVTGQIREIDTDVPLQNAKVTATNTTGSTTNIYYDLTDVNGFYRINIPPAGFGKTYVLEVSKEGYNGAIGYPFYVNNLDRMTYGPIDFILIKDEANGILVQIDGTSHQLVSSGTQNSRHTVTGKLLMDGNPFAIQNKDVTFIIPDTMLVKFVVNNLVVNDRSITVKTDVSGVATATIQTSSTNTGTVTMTGTYTTRDHIILSDWDSLNIQSSGEISGTVTDEYNVILVGASVRLTQYNTITKDYDIYPVKDILGNDLTDRITNSIGVYTFTEVPSGQYKVEAKFSNVLGFAAPVYVTTGTKTANIVIVGALVPSVSISTDKSSYKLGDRMIVSLNLMNPGAITTVKESIWVDMPGGGKHMVMYNPSLSLPVGFKSNTKFPVTLPKIPSGDYAWHAVLENSKNEIISESIAPWTFTGTRVGIESFETVLNNVVIDIE